MMAGRLAPWRLNLVAGLLAAAAQICVASAPLAEARFGADARAHIEVAGSRLHHAHNEADCVACVSQHLQSATEPGRPGRFLMLTAAVRPGDAVLHADSRTLLSLTRSRAPPGTPV